MPLEKMVPQKHAVFADFVGGIFRVGRWAEKLIGDKWLLKILIILINE